MRRDIRKKNRDNELNLQIIKYSGIGIAILAVILFALLIYNKNLNKEVKEGMLTSEKMVNMLNTGNIVENTESASTDIGKSVNEVENELSQNTLKNNTVSENAKTTNNNVLTTNNITATNAKSEKTTNQSNNTTEEKAENKSNVELSFEMPVEGEIVKEFAGDSLIFSETLQEWTTHAGIDIKAEKTTIVKAAESGTVKSIKNDPRYGLTVTIEHENGFQTVYANLLTSEFVVEGEKVEKGQSIGTVGNLAAFEVADEPHLHFEILKDSVAVDPTIYIK